MKVDAGKIVELVRKMKPAVCRQQPRIPGKRKRNL